MKELPILFSGEMVRAILDGRKTQTRRVVKPQPPAGNWRYDGVGDVDENEEDADHEIHWLEQLDEQGEPFHFEKYHAIGKCPYGIVGDRLWLRETFQIHETYGNKPRVIGYMATDKVWDGGYISKVKPSIHMPRWASRITLEITGVRVERLHDISEADALAEGVTLRGMTRYESEARDQFRTLWDSINEKRDFGWDANPWVWVIDFRRVG